jgi:hypothetical protein
MIFYASNPQYLSHQPTCKPRFFLSYASHPKFMIVFYLLVLYLSALSNNPENPLASIYSDSLIKTS